jgi:hypothetical protein
MKEAVILAQVEIPVGPSALFFGADRLELAQA